MKVTNKAELAYVMDFYHIGEFPIFHESRGTYTCGYIVRNKKNKDGVEYSTKKSAYHFNNEDYAFECSFKQIDDVVEVVENLNKKTSAVAVYHWEESTWNYADKEGDAPTHHVYPRTIRHNEEKTWYGTLDELFEKMEEENRRLRYCNGHSYSFKDEKMNKMRCIWYALISEGRKFDLYYGGGIVD